MVETERLPTPALLPEPQIALLAAGPRNAQGVEPVLPGMVRVDESGLERVGVHLVPPPAPPLGSVYTFREATGA